MHKDFFILLKNQDLNALIFEIFYNNFGRQKDENEILSYGKAFFAGAYFGVIYEWILHECIDTPNTIRSKFNDGFKYAFLEAKKNNDNK